VKERLAQDLALWQADGLVSPEAAGVLRARFDVAGFGLAAAAKYLGVVGALFAGFGLLGLIGAMTGSLLAGALLLLAVAAGLLRWGLRMSHDRLGRYAQSSKAVLAVGLFALAGAGAAAAAAAEGEAAAIVLATGLVTVPVAFALAYRFGNGFLLVLALLALFHWVGAWHEMVGRNVYALEVQDPRAMSAVATLAAVVGVLHRRGRFPAPRAFGTAWLAVSLVYLNLSLVILTVDGGHPLGWIVLFAAAGIAQVVAGAIEKSAVLLGFGVTALGVNLFTRYFERFWDGMGKGLFFLLGGAALFAFGAACERLARRAGEVRP
jgi:hypothetical protein